MKYFFFSFSFLFLPTIVFGQAFQDLGEVLDWVLALVNDYFLPLLIALAMLAFFWRNIISLTKKDELASKAEAKWYIFWGIIALFVMVSVWGIVGILADAVGIKNVVPQLDTGGGSTLPPCGTPRIEPCDGGDPLPPCTPGEVRPCANPWDL